MTQMLYKHPPFLPSIYTLYIHLIILFVVLVALFQVITYLHTVMTFNKLNVETCLVVAPLNTVLNWQDEFAKWIGHMDSGIEVSAFKFYLRI